MWYNSTTHEPPTDRIFVSWLGTDVELIYWDDELEEFVTYDDNDPTEVGNYWTEKPE